MKSNHKVDIELTLTLTPKEIKALNLALELTLQTQVQLGSRERAILRELQNEIGNFLTRLEDAR